MVAFTPDLEKTSKTPKSRDEDTFLFMGTRITLPLESGKKANVGEPRQDLSSTEPTAVLTSGTEKLQSSKSTFDFEPLAHSSKSGSSSRVFLLGAGLLFLVATLLFVWNRFGSTEAHMFRAANAGQLVVPQGASAFDLYQRLKADGVSPVTKERLNIEVLPKLSDAGEALLKKVYDGADLSESEQERLIRIFEWASDVSGQSNKLLARRAYAIAYRAVSRKQETEALASLREAFQSDSQWPLPFRELARLYARADNYPNAEYFYQQTFQLDPKWVLPALELGTLALKHNRPTDAELAFRRAIEADPTLPTPWSQLGSLYELQKRKVEAVTAYERALELAEQKLPSDQMTDEIKNRLEKIR